jgi:hypothetical protein
VNSPLGVAFICVAMAASALAPAWAAGTIRSFDLSGDEATLTIRLVDGRSAQAPVAHAEQEAFGDVRVSPNGRYIGWVVELPNCCTSYPLPRLLVVHDGTRVVRRIGPVAPPIFDWAFAPDGRSVVYKQQFPHGSAPLSFHRVSIQDGKALGAFDCFPDDPVAIASKPALPPKWALPIAQDCLAPPGGQAPGHKTPSPLV